MQTQASSAADAVARLLLERGADVTLLEALYGRTALFCATNFPAICTLLEAHGARK